MKCPGQDLQYWKPGAIYDSECPRCGRAVEFFKDDTGKVTHLMLHQGAADIKAPKK